MSLIPRKTCFKFILTQVHTTLNLRHSVNRFFFFFPPRPVPHRKSLGQITQHDFPRCKKAFDPFSYRLSTAMSKERRGSREPGRELPKCSFERGHLLLQRRAGLPSRPLWVLPSLTQAGKLERLLRKTELIRLQGRLALGPSVFPSTPWKNPKALQPPLECGHGLTSARGAQAMGCAGSGVRRQQGLCLNSRAPRLLSPTPQGNSTKTHSHTCMHVSEYAQTSRRKLP